MNIASINSTQSQAVMIEKVINLPKEIFRAEKELDQKMIFLANAQKMHNPVHDIKSSLLDVYA